MPLMTPGDTHGVLSPLISKRNAPLPRLRTAGYPMVMGGYRPQRTARAPQAQGLLPQ